MIREEKGVSASRPVLALAMMALAGLLAVSGGMARAQSNKVLRLIVPFAPGGGQEILARTFYTELGTALGQTVIVENRPGAGGAVGASVVAKAPPDGQMLLVAASNHIVSALVAPKRPHDPIKDFTPVAFIGRSGGQVLLVNSEFPVKTVAEFIKSAKANAGKYNYASAGIGSSSHLAMAMFANTAGLQMVHVPYKSNAEQITELLGGRIHTMFIPALSAVGYANDNRLRMLAITSLERWPLLSQVPAVSETFPGYEYRGWFGLLGPAGMPRPVVDRINREMTRLLKEQAISEGITKQGIEPRALTPEAFGQMMREDYDRIAAIIKQSGITAE